MLLESRIRVAKLDGKALPVPTRNFVSAAAVNTPPNALRARLNDCKSKVPDVIKRFPFTIELLLRKAEPPVLLIVRLSNVVAAMLWFVVPLKITVPVPGLNEPLRIQFPPTLNVAVFAAKTELSRIETLLETVKSAASENVPLFVKIKFPATVAVLVSDAMPETLLNCKL